MHVCMYVCVYIYIYIYRAGPSAGDLPAEAVRRSATPADADSILRHIFRATKYMYTTDIYTYIYIYIYVYMYVYIGLLCIHSTMTYYRRRKRTDNHNNTYTLVDK